MLKVKIPHLIHSCSERTASFEIKRLGYTGKLSEVRAMKMTMILHVIDKGIGNEVDHVEIVNLGDANFKGF